MSEQSSQDRNLPASQRKLNKAREDGQVARSRDLGHFVAVAACGALLVAAAPMAADWLKHTLMQGLQFDRAMLQNPGSMGERLQAMTLRMMWVVVPFGLAMMAAALAASLALGGWNWTLKPLVPNFGKLNPITGLPGMLSKQKLIDALKGSLLALVLGGIGGLYLKSHLDQFAGILALPLPAAIQQTAASMVGGVTLLLLALGVFAMIDVPLQRFQLAQRLKMSHQEMKQEHKELEGNQEIKAKVKARMREMTRRRMMAAVPGADLVVMNPTHYAVALKYDDQKMGAPRVVAKGYGTLAETIIRTARENGLYVHESPELVGLLMQIDLDAHIPPQLYVAIAELLAWLYALEGGKGEELLMNRPAAG